jgi:hypothetical protein
MENMDKIVDDYVTTQLKKHGSPARVIGQLQTIIVRLMLDDNKKTILKMLKNHKK